MLVCQPRNFRPEHRGKEAQDLTGIAAIANTVEMAKLQGVTPGTAEPQFATPLSGQSCGATDTWDSRSLYPSIA
jgi:hypothetical protein